MPVYIALQGVLDGLSSIPQGHNALKAGAWLLVLAALKRYFGGARNASERLMHGKVVMMTGGTSGVGAAIAEDLARRGAQLVLLTQHPLSDPFLAEYVLDLRARTGNQLVTAERVDLGSLHSVRQFATKWVDNAPPRRLDMVILCADSFTPGGGKRGVTQDGLELAWGVGYLAHFHLLSILSPALRAQPPDRDVRVVFAACSSMMGGELPLPAAGAYSLSKSSSPPPAAAASSSSSRTPAKGASSPSSSAGKSILLAPPRNPHATAKLALATFALAFQKHLSAHARPDSRPCNARVLVADPGWTRTPGTRRHLTRGSLFPGLLLYLLLYPLAWLLLKSPAQGAQSFLFAAMEAGLGLGEGGVCVKECRVVRLPRGECADEDVQRELWGLSERTVEVLEREGAKRRAREKKERGEVRAEGGGKEGAEGAEGKASGAKERKAGSRRSRKAG